MAQYVWGFYEHLYSMEPENEKACVAQVESFASIPKMVTKAMNQELLKEITIEELREIIVALPCGKTLGHNGFSIELFQNTFEEIGGNLLEAF